MRESHSLSPLSLALMSRRQFELYSGDSTHNRFPPYTRKSPKAPIEINYLSLSLSLVLQTITCDCEATPALQLKAFCQRGDKIETSHYRVNVNRFRARLNVVSITEKLLVDIKCDGWPEVCLNFQFKALPKVQQQVLKICGELMNFNPLILLLRAFWLRGQ